MRKIISYLEVQEYAIFPTPCLALADNNSGHRYESTLSMRWNTRLKNHRTYFFSSVQVFPSSLKQQPYHRHLHLVICSIVRRIRKVQ